MSACVRICPVPHMRGKNGCLAQLVEHPRHMREVEGSSPPTPTRTKPRSSNGVFQCNKPIQICEMRPVSDIRLRREAIDCIFSGR